MKSIVVWLNTEDLISAFFLTAFHASLPYHLLKHWNRLFLNDDIDMNDPPKYNGYFKKKMNYYELFQLLLNVDPNLTKAYELIDDYRTFNRTATIDNCKEKLDQLIMDFTAANLPCYENFLQTLINWHDEIINSFQKPDGSHKPSNALAENTNQRIRKMISASNGYSNFERFRSRVLFCLNKNVFYSLTTSLSSRKRNGKNDRMISRYSGLHFYLFFPCEKFIARFLQFSYETLLKRDFF